MDNIAGNNQHKLIEILPDYIDKESAENDETASSNEDALQEPLHQGHRERLRTKFIESGFDSFSDHEILEMILFYSIPRRDTNEIAHKLINSCGSLSAVFDAPQELLEEMGLSENSAVLIRAISEFYRVYIENKYYNEKKRYSKNELYRKLINSFLGLSEERVILVLFDNSGRELFYGIVNKGSYHSAELNCRRITELAVRYHAQSLVVAHNHPSGVAYPSHADIATTISLAKSLASVGVVFQDHIIVASTSLMSFRSDPFFAELIS